MCTNPLKGFKYGLTENGKDKYYIRPYKVDHLEVDDSGKIENVYYPAPFQYGHKVIREFIEIPCGKCLECRMDYARVWSNRCYLESLDHKDNCFITLTYDDEHVPVKDTYNKFTGEIAKYKTLRKRDFQLFMKRLREKVGVPIRYYACGEYGGNTKRPHYHAIIFGWQPDDMILWQKNNLDQPLYISPTLQSCWEYGFTSVGACTPESCSYVARYVQKKANPVNEDAIKVMEVEPEFVLMSRRPGIGSSWFESNKECYAIFLNNYSSNSDGSIKISHNRFFDSRLEKSDPDLLEEIKKNRKEFAKEKKRLELKQTSLPYSEYLKVKDDAIKARTKILNIRKEI